MPLTLAELFNMGAHHTVEYVLGTELGGSAEAVAALTRRFGPVIGESAVAVNELITEVGYAVQASRDIPFQRFPSVRGYGTNPDLPEEYQYIVIGTVPNPLNPDQQVSVPWSINSPTPLQYQDVLAEAEKQLNEGYQRPDRYMAASYADLHRRDIAFQRLVQEQFGGQAPIDIQIIGVYKRA